MALGRRGPVGSVGIGHSHFQRSVSGGGCNRPAGLSWREGRQRSWRRQGLEHQQRWAGRSRRPACPGSGRRRGGPKIGSLAELSAILSGLNPGDRLSLEFVRGIRPLRAEVVLGAAPGAPGTPPPSGPGAGRTESIPPPPGETLPPLAPSEGPSLVVPGSPPQPNPPTSPQAQIEQLRHRVDQLERRVEELERALAESRRK